MSDEDNMEVEYEEDEPYQSDPEQDDEAALEDMYYEAAELVRKDKFQDAVNKFNELINESQKASAYEWICKSLTNILMIRCKENSAEVLTTLSRLLQSIDKVPKKDAETAVKSAIDYVSTRLKQVKGLPNRDLYRQAKQQLIRDIELKTDETLKLRTYLRLAEQDLIDSDLKSCKVLLDRVKQLDQEGKFPAEKVSDFKLELCCLEIQYLQKSDSDPEQIKAIIKSAQSLKTDMNDSKVNAVIKENIGKMFIHQEEYERAAVELMDAFKEYSLIGDPQAKNMLKYAAFIGMLSKQEINPFANVEAQIYKTHDDVKNIENLRAAFQKRDQLNFNRQVEFPAIQDDPVLKTLVGPLKDIMIQEHLKVILRPYERVGFDYLSTCLKVRPERIHQFVFKLIVEGEVRGKINSIEGYFQKDKEFDIYTDLEQQNVENYLKYLTAS